MKKMIALASLIASVYGLNANALFTKCEIDTQVTSLDFGIEVGFGTGTATCVDIAGNSYTAPLTVALDVGAGLEVGECQVATHYTAVGVGFAIDRILGAMAEIEIVPGTGKGVAGGVEVNPLGADVEITVAKVDSSNCGAIANVKGQIVVRSGPLAPVAQ